MSFAKDTSREARPAMAHPHGRATARQKANPRRSLLVGSAALVCALAGLLILATFPDSATHALNAAGAFKGEAIGGVANYVDKLKGNLVWLGGTTMGLVIAVVGIMFMAGHSRAHDIALRTVVGLAILASLSGIVA
jgi:hypothetical protein